MGQESRYWVLCLGSHQALINVLGGPHFHVDISLGGECTSMLTQVVGRIHILVAPRLGSPAFC